jgi:hypothetical protein
MGRTLRILTAGAFAAAALALAAGPASAATKTVCSSGCPFTSIQAAIEAATPGATITIGPGSYYENVVVKKSLTLKGAGMETIVYPASSMPVCGGGSLCGGAASNIILVQASNVTITNMWLKGDNPKLTSGVVVGGEDIDARNGIITNHLLGTYQNLTVSRVKVTGVYLRGMYASSGGTFNFNHDTVENVQAEEASIAMFDFGGAGEMTNNTVKNANDAISANHSTGTKFVHNTITKSGSGVHTDNAGEAGSADLIQSNTVRECKLNGYGIFVFVPYKTATVESNKVSGCSVGLAAFGGAVAGQGPTFTNNVVSGSGAATSGATYGAYLTTDQLGFAWGNLNATLTGNRFLHFDTGMFVTQTSPTPGQPAGGQATISATPNNSFQSNGTGANGEPGTVVNATNDWWGCAAGPNKGGTCNTALGTVAYTPWLTTKP